MAQLPPKDMLLGETVGVLNMAAAKTSRLLQHHQQQLVQNLNQYLKDQGHNNTQSS